MLQPGKHLVFNGISRNELDLLYKIVIFNNFHYTPLEERIFLTGFHNRREGINEKDFADIVLHFYNIKMVLSSNVNLTSSAALTWLKYHLYLMISVKS